MAARSRPRAKGCNSPTGSCRLRSAAGSAKMRASARRAAADECVRSAGFDPNGSRFSAAGRSFRRRRPAARVRSLRPFASCCPKRESHADAAGRKLLPELKSCEKHVPLPLPPSQKKDRLIFSRSALRSVGEYPPPPPRTGLVFERRLVRYRQLLAALRTARSQYLATVRRSHASAETVLVDALATRGLVSSLHCHSCIVFIVLDFFTECKSTTKK